MSATQIVFVCLHGSAKSLIAAECFNRAAAERGMPFRALSAGTEPDAAVPPHVVAGMRGDGFDVGRVVPRLLSRDLLAGARIAITFEPDIAPYVAPGCIVERWSVPAVSDDYGIARDAIKARVDAFISKLAG